METRGGDRTRPSPFFCAACPGLRPPPHLPNAAPPASVRDSARSAGGGAARRGNWSENLQKASGCFAAICHGCSQSLLLLKAVRESAVQSESGGDEDGTVRRAGGQCHERHRREFVSYRECHNLIKILRSPRLLPLKPDVRDDVCSPFRLTPSVADVFPRHTTTLAWN